jgi:hypothetical protein
MTKLAAQSYIVDACWTFPDAALEVSAGGRACPDLEPAVLFSLTCVTRADALSGGIGRTQTSCWLASARRA